MIDDGKIKSAYSIFNNGSMKNPVSVAGVTDDAHAKRCNCLTDVDFTVPLVYGLVDDHFAETFWRLASSRIATSSTDAWLSPIASASARINTRETPESLKLVACFGVLMGTKVTHDAIRCQGDC